jgi:hypothetical protein
MLKLASLAAALALVVAESAGGQFWQGPAGMAVQVNKGQGKPLAGAEVVLRYLEILPESGPPPAPTDAQGRVVFSHLAEGNWQLDVRHEGYARYFAVVRLVAGKKPIIISGPVRHADGLPLRLKLLKVRPAPSPVPEVPDRPADQAPPPQPEETESPGPGSPEPADRPPEVVQDRAAAAAAPAPAVTPGSVEPDPSPAQPASAAASALRVFGMRSCPDCRAGEWAFSTERSAAPAVQAGSPESGCSEEAARVVQEAVGRMVEAVGEMTDSLAGPLIDPDSGETIRLPDESLRAELDVLFRPYADPHAACQLVGVVLPADASFTGYRYEARDGSGSGDCVGDRECVIGACRWRGHPVVKQASGATVVYGLFDNQARDRRRVARLTVYFRRQGGG